MSGLYAKMRDGIVGKPEEEKSAMEKLEDQMEENCPSLTWTQRLIGFVLCCGVGMLLTLGSFFRFSKVRSHIGSAIPHCPRAAVPRWGLFIIRDYLLSGKPDRHRRNLLPHWSCQAVQTVLRLRPFVCHCHILGVPLHDSVLGPGR